MSEVCIPSSGERIQVLSASCFMVLYEVCVRYGKVGSDGVRRVVGELEECVPCGVHFFVRRVGRGRGFEWLAIWLVLTGLETEDRVRVYFDGFDLAGRVCTVYTRQSAESDAWFFLRTYRLGYGMELDCIDGIVVSSNGLEARRGVCAWEFCAEGVVASSVARSMEVSSGCRTVAELSLDDIIDVEGLCL